MFFFSPVIFLLQNITYEKVEFFNLILYVQIHFDVAKKINAIFRSSRAIDSFANGDKFDGFMFG